MLNLHRTIIPSRLRRGGAACALATAHRRGSCVSGIRRTGVRATTEGHDPELASSQLAGLRRRALAQSARRIARANQAGPGHSLPWQCRRSRAG